MDAEMLYGAGLLVAGVLAGFLGGKKRAMVQEADVIHIPQAKNGMITLDELKSHCMHEQAMCVKVLGVKLDSIEIKMQDRLDRGSQQFEQIKIALENMSDDIAGLK